MILFELDKVQLCLFRSNIYVNIWDLKNKDKAKGYRTTSEGKIRWHQKIKNIQSSNQSVDFFHSPGYNKGL